MLDTPAKCMSFPAQRGTKDGAVDIFALRLSTTFGQQRFLLQAKRYKNKVGVEPVRQLAFLHPHYNVTKSCLATTLSFTRGAWELADQYKCWLDLRDAKGIIDWHTDCCSKFLIKLPNK
jgi:restriction system protein